MADGRHDVILFPYEERQEGVSPIVRRLDSDELARDARAFAIRRQINPFCGLYRRSAFLAAGGYDEDPRVLFNEDVAMHIGLAFAGLSFAAETEVAIINHRRSDSMSAANQLRCIQAHHEVLRKTAARRDALAYASPLAAKLWAAAGVLAAHLDWEGADAAAKLARRLAAPDGSPPFRALARISPALALRIRERLIRLFKPGLRAGYPRARTP